MPMLGSATSQIVQFLDLLVVKNIAVLWYLAQKGVLRISVIHCLYQNTTPILIFP